MYGHQLMIAIPDLDRTSFFLVVGANPMASNGSLMTVPDFPNRVRELQGPRRPDGRARPASHRDRQGRRRAPLRASGHRRRRPARDAAGHPDRGPRPPAGVRRRARPPRRARGRLHPGARRARARACRPTSCATWPATSSPPTPASSTAGWASRPRRSGPCASGRSPASTCCRATSTPPAARCSPSPRSTPSGARIAGPGPLRPVAQPGARRAGVRRRAAGLDDGRGDHARPARARSRAMVTVAGNPVLSTPGGHDLADALDTLDFMVSVDFYLNETTRHADVILPPTSALERDQYDLVFHGFAVRNTARLTPAVFEPDDDQRHDWQIFGELTTRIAERLGTPLSDDAAGRSRPRRRPTWSRCCSTPAAAPRWPTCASTPRASTSARCVRRCPTRLQTAEQRIDLVPELWSPTTCRGCVPRSTRRRPADGRAGAHRPPPPARLQLVAAQHHAAHQGQAAPPPAHAPRRPGRSRHHRRRPGLGQLAGGPRRGRGERRRRHDARRRLAPPRLRPPGRRHPPGPRLRTVPGVSINDLTDPALLDVVSGNAALSGVPVRVEALASTA